LSALTLFAFLAPDAATTRLDAWAESVGVGIAAGLIALCVTRPRHQGRRNLLDLLTGLAAVGLLTGILRGACGSRGRGWM
jgi:hypothetical protein